MIINNQKIENAIKESVLNLTDLVSVPELNVCEYEKYADKMIEWFNTQKEAMEEER